MDREAHNQLHGKYLKDFRPTDVITFPADQEMNWPERFAYPSTRLLMSPKAGDSDRREEISLYLIHGWLYHWV